MAIKHLLLPASLCVLLASGADAALWTFNDTLSGLQEVPPNSSPAAGTAIGTYDDVTNLLNITVAADGFATTITGAHIHGPADVGTNAGIVFSLGVAAGAGHQYYTVNNFTLSAQQETEFLAGLNYVNIHTTAFAGGEIRAQLNPVPEPATMVALGLGAAALMARRRKRA
jgi:hypothetical protein